MNVKDIIKDTCKLLELSEVLNVIDDAIISEDNQNEINFLVDCLNLTLNTIATEYVPLYSTKEITSTGTINFSDIDMNLLSVLKVTKNECKTLFKVFPNAIRTVSGKVNILYTTYPSSKSITDNISEFPPSVSARVIAYGIASEYCLVRGRNEDSLLWENRFKNTLMVVARKKNEIYIRPRRWL